MRHLLTTDLIVTRKQMSASTARRGLVHMTTSLEISKNVDCCTSSGCKSVFLSIDIASRRTTLHYMDRVAYIWSSALQDACDQLPCNRYRSTVVHDLHRAYGLLDGSDLTVYEPDLSLGDVGHLTRFHNRDYIGMRSRVRCADIRSYTGRLTR
jgi:hypothetical protein